MTGNRIASLAFGLIVTITAGAFFGLMWFASSLPTVAVA
jgi:hypothetical protein